MPLMEQVQSLLSSFVDKLNNARALPGKIVAATAAVVSAIFTFTVVQPAAWVWSKMPSAPRPASWLSRVSNFLFGPTAPAPEVLLKAAYDAVLAERNDLTEKLANTQQKNEELALEVTKANQKIVDKDSMIATITKDRDDAMAALQQPLIAPTITPAADEQKKKKPAFALPKAESLRKAFGKKKNDIAVGIGE